MSTHIDRTYQLFTMNDLASLLQISRATVYRLKDQQGWPHQVYGTRVRFSLEDVAAIQKMNQAPPRRDPSEAPRIGVAAKRGPHIGTRAKRAWQK
ncbi:helix-turn-helix domain-containing protein [Paenarthrobacter sp. NPDC057355]|uniref:helix-turn-helix domain-containing protein n=1 Tax=Paenarthrobacter sp. NPDC057355 TaxID=3346105 RepID=UPI003640D398